MIKNKSLLNEVNTSLRIAMNNIDFQFRIHDVEVMEGFLEKKDFDLLSKQGGNLSKYNSEREKNELSPIKAIRNHKVIDKSWKKHLTTHIDDHSNGLVFVPLMRNARIHLTKGLERALKGVLKGTDVKYKKINNDLFSSVLLYIEQEETKEGGE